MAIKKTQLIDAHPKWKEYIQEWQFLMDSYIGGKDYFDGEYLTSYIFESREEYEERLANTALDNHVKSVVAIMNAFLFRSPPQRDFGSLTGDPALDPFLNDADLDGRSFDTVMRDISTYATIYGTCWVLIDKPNTNLMTRAEELQQGVRPYVSIFTPENVLDWQYARSPNGVYYLTYLKVFEGNTAGRDVFRIYTPDTITVMSLGATEDTATIDMTMPNTLGMIPAVCVYSQRTGEKGIGISDIADVARMQRAIYNELSELEQLERISNHPSLVLTPNVSAHAGAGALIKVPEDTPDGLKPYLLQPSAASIDSLLNSVKQKVEAIDRMAHMGGIRSIESRRLSGIALATEFQLLNARLAEKADNLEHAEEQIWRIFARWQNTIWNGVIKYPDSFNIQDKYNDVNMLKTIKDSGIENPVLKTEVEDQMLRMIVDADRYEMLKSQPQLNTVIHRPVMDAGDLVIHLREMIAAGYTNEQILNLHPEIADLFESESQEMEEMDDDIEDDDMDDDNGN